MLAFYRDHQIPAVITSGLRECGVDVVTACEAGAAVWTDKERLERAATLDRAVATLDQAFLRLARDCWREGREFAGVVYGPQDQLQIGRTVLDPELIALTIAPDESTNWVECIPLQRTTRGRPGGMRGLRRDATTAPHLIARSFGMAVSQSGL